MSRVPRISAGLLVILALLSAVGPLATDMYLPSFTDISGDLGTNPSSVKLTLTAFMMGMALGQLLLGPLSDAFGRRPVLLTALTIFAASSVALVFTPNIVVFVALRALQGLSGTAGVVLSRAIVADLQKGADAVRALSLLMMMSAVAPIAAPLIGGVTSEAWGWRGVLAVLAAATALMLVLALLFVPESLPVAERNTSGIGATLAHFRRLLGDWRFVLLVVMICTAFAALLSYISASPFVAQVMLGLSPAQFSLAFAVGALAMVSANLANARLAGRVPPLRMLTFGSSLVLLAGVALTVLTLTGALVPATFIASAFVLSGGVAFVLSNASAIALGRADFARGAGSSLLGAAQFLGGGIVSPIVGAWGEHTACRWRSRC